MRSFFYGFRRWSPYSLSYLPTIMVQGTFHCHVLLRAALAWHFGTVYARFGLLSHVTVPELDTFTNLYCIDDPAAMDNVIVQIGLLDVYDAAESAGALAGVQLPSCVVLPVILIVSPKAVVTLCVNDIATAVGHADADVTRVVDAGTLTCVLRVAATDDATTEDAAADEAAAVEADTAEARRTTGSPFDTVTQMLPLPSAVTVDPLPYTFVHFPLAFWVLKQC